MYTSHGHQIAGTPVEEQPIGSLIARCGGPGICAQCSREAASNSAQAALLKPAEGEHKQQSQPLRTVIGIPTDDEKVLTYTEMAIQTVFLYVKAHLEKTDTHVTFARDEVYVVWFCKTLKNWKALVSTSLPDGMYYEVTFNGESSEIYLDAYKKFENISYQVIDLP